MQLYALSTAAAYYYWSQQCPDSDTSVLKRLASSMHTKVRCSVSHIPFSGSEDLFVYCFVSALVVWLSFFSTLLTDRLWRISLKITCLWKSLVFVNNNNKLSIGALSQHYLNAGNSQITECQCQKVPKHDFWHFQSVIPSNSNKNIAKYLVSHLCLRCGL